MQLVQTLVNLQNLKKINLKNCQQKKNFSSLSLYLLLTSRGDETAAEEDVKSSLSQTLQRGENRFLFKYLKIILFHYIEFNIPNFIIYLLDFKL